MTSSMNLLFLLKLLSKIIGHCEKCKKIADSSPTPSRFNIVDRPVRGSDDPLHGRPVFQTPDVRVLWMLLDRRHRLRQVIKPLGINVVGIKMGIVIEHDHVAPQAEAERQRHGLPTGPAGTGLTAISPQRFPVIEVLCATHATVRNRIA